MDVSFLYTAFSGACVMVFEVLLEVCISLYVTRIFLHSEKELISERRLERTGGKRTSQTSALQLDLCKINQN